MKHFAAVLAAELASRNCPCEPLETSAIDAATLEAFAKAPVSASVQGVARLAAKVAVMAALQHVLGNERRAGELAVEAIALAIVAGLPRGLDEEQLARSRVSAEEQARQKWTEVCGG